MFGSLRQPLEPVVTRLQLAAKSVAGWWLRELVAMVPPHFAAWATAAGREQLCLIRKLNDGFEVELRSVDRTIDRSQFSGSLASRAEIDDWLRSRTKSLRPRFGLVLPSDCFFERTFEVPEVAMRSLREIAECELDRTTPFRRSEIFHSEAVTESGGRSKQGKVTQTVIKRRFVEEACAALGIAVESFDFVTYEKGAADTSQRVALHPVRQVRRWPSQLIGVLAGAAILLVGASYVLGYWRNSMEVSRLDEDIAKAKAAFAAAEAKASIVRRRQAVLEQVRRMQAEAKLIDVWQEITRQLPDDAWLSDLQLDATPDGREVQVSGFATGAAALVPLLGNSSLFEKVWLAAAVTADPVEHKERFTIRIRLRSAKSSERKA